MTDHELQQTTNELISLCAALMDSRQRLTARERRLLLPAQAVDDQYLDDVRQAIRQGQDPLGDAFVALRSGPQRRKQGATYTPDSIVRAMVESTAQSPPPDCVVDPGTGSGRFLLEAGRRFPRAELVGVEKDPLAALMARANLSAAGMGERGRILLRDYRTVRRPHTGRILFIGNPPYVRHHELSGADKEWLHDTGQSLGLSVSRLSGLYVHFLVATAKKLRPGDFGCLITAGEWLDVNYGQAVRTLLLDHLGCRRLSMISPSENPFPDAATTATVIQFEKNFAPAAQVTFTASLNGRSTRTISRSELRKGTPWRKLLLPAVRRSRTDLVPLSRYCDVRRGQVTGANKFWVASPGDDRIPARFRYRTVTRARELFQSEGELRNASLLREVVDLPADLDSLTADEREQLEEFLREAQRQGVHLGYIARNRRSWWSVGLYEPAPIIATYMARRPPAFVCNTASVRHLNIAHGIYPQVDLSATQLRELADYLNQHVRMEDGRTYAGGLTKFEPSEMGRLLVPELEVLQAKSA